MSIRNRCGLGRRRRWVVVAAAALALLAAGTAGAVVRYTIITIKDGNFAHLTGTNIYCQNGVSTAHFQSFLCSKWIFAGSGHRQTGTYGALLNETGIGVYRVTANDRIRNLRQYLHKR